MAEVCDHICVDGVRAATHTGYDRVVFDLGEGPLPTVEATHSTSSGYDTPGGEPRNLVIPGSSYLFLSLKGAGDGDFLTTNPGVESFNLPTVKASQFLFDTDAILGFSPAIDFGITLDSPVSRYKVFTLTQPNRVVVDIYR
ncbi:AMIN-like domain-containing (lipo)protein [Streptomyces sp. S1]|uniref:AMIN-like domain-containing (lipo)protein n=1 Tax=Streptomyces sp. S1 TaxID=718288 RepID=UPI003D73D0AF